MLFLQIKYKLTCFAALLSLFVLSQVELDNKIILNGSGASDNQVTGVSTPYDTTNLIPASVVQFNELEYVKVVGIDSLIGTTNLSINPLLSGTRLVVQIDTSNTGPVVLNVNGSGFKPVLRNVTDTLRANAVNQGEIIVLIYDGENYQIVNREERTCPEGYVEVNKEYCIQQVDNPPVTWWQAAENCHNEGAKLCTWSQWYYACQKSGLGLAAMTNNSEWLNTPVNSQDQAMIIGNGSCQDGNVTNATTNIRYRCCFLKQ